MAKNNVRASIQSSLDSNADVTTNHEGARAFMHDALTRLYTRVAASFAGERKAYRGAEESNEELVADIRAAAAVDPEGILRLAAYTRQVLNMRSTSILLLTEAASIPACKPFVRRWTPEIVRRADEPAEVIAYWQKTRGSIGAGGQKGGEHAFPNSLTRGLEDAMKRFDAYQLDKYNRTDATVKMRDVLRVVRPKPDSEARSALYKFIVKGELDGELLPLLAAKANLLRKPKGEFDDEAKQLLADGSITWEVATSHFGSKPEVWDAIEFNFMAGLRNVRKLLQVGARKALGRVMAQLRDEGCIRHSKQLPFRFFSAYKAVETVEGADEVLKAELLDAILGALALSMSNLPKLGGVTFITADNSGSMQQPISERSMVQIVDIANLIASMGHTMCDSVITSAFGTNHQVVTLSKRDSVLTNMRLLATTPVGGSTEAWKTVRWLNETKTRVDRIILLSDMQCYTAHGYSVESLAEELRKYRSSVNPEVYLYSVDLAGYGTSQFPRGESRVATIAGWSERVLEFIPEFEAGGMASVIGKIMCWEPPVRRAHGDERSSKVEVAATSSDDAEGEGGEE